ncbi:XRE family transcriptional regulator [Stenotrophomonas sp. FS3]
MSRQRHSVTAFRSNVNMETIGSRIRAEREAQGVSRAELARSAGIAPSTLSDLELGLSKSTTALHKIARRLGLRPEWLETGRGSKDPATDTSESDWADIDGYAQAIGLGGGPEAQEYAETHKLKFRAESLARKRLRPNNLAVMYGKGDSMEPRIHSGDAILFDTSDVNPRDGQMYVIMVDGGGAAKEYHVKRCEVIDDLVFFKADNPRGDHNWRKPKRLDSPKHPIQVIGRVRWIGSWEG